MNFMLTDIDPDWWAKVKAKAALEKVSIKALVYRLLEEWLTK